MRGSLNGGPIKEICSIPYGNYSSFLYQLLPQFGIHFAKIRCQVLPDSILYKADLLLSFPGYVPNDSPPLEKNLMENSNQTYPILLVNGGYHLQ